MKRSFLPSIIFVFSFACNSDLKVNEEKLNKAGDKLQKTVEKGADSVASKLKKLKNKLDDKKGN